MKRYQPAATMNIPENKDGSFCLYSDTVLALPSAIKFAFDQADEIENDYGDFGTLKPILAMIHGTEVEH